MGTQTNCMCTSKPISQVTDINVDISKSFKKSIKISCANKENTTRITKRNNITFGEEQIKYYHQLYLHEKKTIILSSPKKSNNECSVLCPNKINDLKRGVSPKEEDKDNNVISSAKTKEKLLPYIQKTLSQDEINNILRAWNNYFWFANMPKQMMELLIYEFEQYSFDKNEIIYNQGAEGSYFYIVAKGECISLINNVEKKQYWKWDCFGGLSLWNDNWNNKREETVRTKTQVEWLCLSKDIYIKLQEKNVDDQYKDRFFFINNISFLKQWDAVTKYKLSESISTWSYKANQTIIKTGENADSMYFIKEGEVSCQFSGVEVRKLRNQNCFGEIGLWLNSKRCLDIVATESTILYEITKRTLVSLLGETFIDILLFSIFRINWMWNPFFKDILIDSVLLKLFERFKLIHYQKNEIVFHQNKSNDERNNKIILIVEGSLFFENSDSPIAGKGDVLGEDNWFQGDIVYSTNIIAKPDCIALQCNSGEIKNILGMTLSMTEDINNTKMETFNWYKRISQLKKLYLFKNLSEKTLENIASLMKKEKFSENAYIFKENTYGDSLYLIIKGRVQITKNNKFIRFWDNGSCFGEIAWISNNKQEKRTATVMAVGGPLTCYLISKGDFDKILWNNRIIKEHLVKQIALQNNEIQWKEWYFYKFLGKGKFGNVNWVHNKKYIYAIKSVSRFKVDREKILGQYLVNERRVMLTLDHPFIIRLIKTLKNKRFCFFLIEFINGMNLDDYLSQKSKMKNTEETQFYLAILVIIFEYLQSKNIVHRDIKPSNIMIDSNGYWKWIDFGTAKVLTDYTKTVVGTPHYIAPEILLGKGYTSSCDFWSWGIIAFEMFYGEYPFGNYANEIMEIYKEIVNKEFTLPSVKPKYENINEFIKKLLVKNVTLRITSGSELKKLKLFQDFEWDKLIDMNIFPPYIPKCIDVSNVLNNDLILFEKEINKDKSDFDETRCDDQSISNMKNNYDNTWANEF